MSCLVVNCFCWGSQTDNPSNPSSAEATSNDFLCSSILFLCPESPRKAIALTALLYCAAVPVLVLPQQHSHSEMGLGLFTFAAQRQRTHYADDKRLKWVRDPMMGQRYNRFASHPRWIRWNYIWSSPFKSYWIVIPISVQRFIYSAAKSLNLRTPGNNGKSYQFTIEHWSEFVKLVNGETFFATVQILRARRWNTYWPTLHMQPANISCRYQRRTAQSLSNIPVLLANYYFSRLGDSVAVQEVTESNLTSCLLMNMNLFVNYH